jgi:hypothetical protein
MIMGLSSSALACLTSHRLAAAHDDALIRRLVEGLVNIPKLIARGQRVGEISVQTSWSAVHQPWAIQLAVRTGEGKEHLSDRRFLLLER